MRSTEQILGLPFFQGSPEEAVRHAVKFRGLIVVPSGTCFARLQEDPIYREAMTSADIVLPDSGLMVSLWRLLRRRTSARISGLAYLQALVQNLDPSALAAVFWVVPNEQSHGKLLAWLSARHTPTASDRCYLAPMYTNTFEDNDLLDRLRATRPDHIVIALAGGVQEKLGFWLRERLPYRPAIHCIGGALGFITGDQVAIPAIVDRLYLGWFLRLLANPRRFGPRLWNARHLPGLILRHGSELPPIGK